MTRSCRTLGTLWAIPPMRRSCGRDLISKGSGLDRSPGPARASTPKPESVCLTILCLSPTLLTLTGGYPQPPFSGKKSQLRALVDKSLGHERSISNPLLALQLTGQVYPDSCNIVEAMLAAKFSHPLSIVFLGMHIVRVQKKQVIALALATLDFELISSFFAVTR